MLSLKADVLTVEYDYNSRNFIALDGRERMQLLFAKDDTIRSIQELEKVIGSIKTFIAE